MVTPPDIDTPEMHGMLDSDKLGDPEDCLEDPVTKMFGKEVEIYDLSHPFGKDTPLWPYFDDVEINRVHYHAKSRVLSQELKHTMHVSTHADSPVHVEEGYPYTHELPLGMYMGEGVVVSIPKGKWEKITAEDLEEATPEIQEGDMVMVNTGWHKHWGDSTKYFSYAPGFYKDAGEWFVEKGVKAVGIDTQALDHPLGTKEAQSFGEGDSPVLPWLVDAYERETGNSVEEDFPYWEPCHRLLLTNGIAGFENVGGEIDEVTGERVTIVGLPLRWDQGDGSIVRLVAIKEADDT